jgi:phosphatidylserine decarboxylase
MSSSIQFYNRESGEYETEIVAADAAIQFCYGNPVGRLLTDLMICRSWVSSLVGMYFNSRFSCRRIPAFVESLKIKMEEAERPVEEYKSFNDFFSRTLKPEARPVVDSAHSAACPADGRVSVIPTIDGNRVFQIKGVKFQLEQFLPEASWNMRYINGSMAIIRLCPADYHRFHFPADGTPLSSERQKGVLYSVNPAAIRIKPDLFCKNERQFCELQTEKFGRILCIEVGATVVGKIQQTYVPEQPVKKGQEKGTFLCGGSTVVLLFEPGKIQFSKDLVEQSAKGMETLCKMGTELGTGINV